MHICAIHSFVPNMLNKLCIIIRNQIRYYVFIQLFKLDDCAPALFTQKTRFRIPREIIQTLFIWKLRVDPDANNLDHIKCQYTADDDDVPRIEHRLYRSTYYIRIRHLHNAPWSLNTETIHKWTKRCFDANANVQIQRVWCFINSNYCSSDLLLQSIS